MSVTMADSRLKLVLAIVVFMCYDNVVAKEYAEWGKAIGVSPFIYGGDLVHSAELYPWHVAILLQSNYHAGGSLISDQFVLTATHVAYDFVTSSMIAPSKLSIKAGVVKLNEKTKEIQVEQIFPYPGFNQNKLYNDICLLKLKEKVSFSATVRPVLLWDNANVDVSTLIERKLKGTVVGWGLTETGEHSNDLLSAPLAFVDEQKCLKEVTAYKGILEKDHSYCANGAGQNVCRGDSGSGMFLYDQDRDAYYLRGLVSQGKGVHGCQHKKPSLFTDVVYYLKWIEKITLPTRYNLLGHPSCPSVTTDADSHVTLPGLVHLKYAIRKKLFFSACHGVLISNEHVLTHVDCVKETGIRKLQSVGIGSNAFNDYSRPYKEYGYKLIAESNELAIITLSNKVQDGTIQPVCLPARPELGEFDILFWRQKSPYPKYMQRLNVSSDAVENVAIIHDTLKANISDVADGVRLEAAPLVYTVIEKAGSHFFVRAIEKCSASGCQANGTASFVDILKYRRWIRSVAGKEDDDSYEPPLFVDPQNLNSR